MRVNEFRKRKRRPAHLHRLSRLAGVLFHYIAPRRLTDGVHRAQPVPCPAKRSKAKSGKLRFSVGAASGLYLAMPDKDKVALLCRPEALCQH